MSNNPYRFMCFSRTCTPESSPTGAENTALVATASPFRTVPPTVVLEATNVEEEHEAAAGTVMVLAVPASSAAEQKKT